MLSQRTKSFFCYGTKTNNRLFPRINRLFWFWQLNHLKNSFQPFLKTPKYKTIGCFDKTIGCFSLSLKNTFLLKRLRMLMLWIQSRVNYKTQSTPDPIWDISTTTSTNFNILQRVWILQSLNTTWFNNLPLFDEDKSLMLVLYLIESEAVPAKHKFKQSIELLIFG